MHKKQKNNKGFTLMEIMVVIAIMAILAGGGVSAYQRGLRINIYLNTINEVDALIKETHSIAIASRAQKSAQFSDENEVDAELKPIGITIPLNNTKLLPVNTAEVISFQDLNENNQYDPADEIIRSALITDPTALKAIGEEKTNRITIIYHPPRATAHIYKDTDFITSHKSAAFMLVDHFGDHKRGKVFKFLRSTGIPLISDLK